MGLSIFESLRPFRPREALRDALAGVGLASLSIPEVLGYTRIAGTPVITGLYTVLLPLVGFAVFGSSRIWLSRLTRRPRRSSPVRFPTWRRRPVKNAWP